MTRSEISLTDNTKDVLVTLAEGNPGALRVLMQLLAGDGGLFDLLHLDDMNIRGTQVWVAFKDFAKEDLAAFRVAIRKRDPEMIRVVNAEGARGNHDWLAVAGQASSGNRRKLPGVRSAPDAQEPR